MSQAQREIPEAPQNAGEAEAASERSADAGREHVKQARLHAAACRARLRLASDALAAADLLLGLNWSVGACGEAKR